MTTGSDFPAPVGKPIPGVADPKPPGRIPYFDRPPPPHDWHWALAITGRCLIALGLLMFAFVGYQLWGTGIETAQAQNRLESEFEELLAATTTTTATTATTTTVNTDVTTTIADVTATTVVAPPTESTEPATATTLPAAAPSSPIPNGKSAFKLVIPKIGLDVVVVEGVKASDLKKGPGHFRETVMPGQLGNSAIAGHRTTYGHPFLKLDRLQVGDLIEITTLVGHYTYEVTGTVIVRPNDYAKVIPTIDSSVATLALATCHPAYTARERLVVQAILVPELSGQVFVPPPNTTPPDVETTIPGEDLEPTDVVESTLAPEATATPTAGTTPGAPTASAPPDVSTPDESVAYDTGDDAFTQGWFSDKGAIPHALAWGAILALVAIGSYRIGRAARRLYVSFLVGLLPFTLVLYFFFQNVNRLMPPSL